MDRQEVNDLDGLYEQSKDLYNKVVCEKADTIIDDLDKAIDILQNSWGGADAGVQINNVVGVFNNMLTVRNALANLAKNAVDVAVYYKDIQFANRANKGEYQSINIADHKTPKADYVDERDIISINEESLKGKDLLDAVVDLFDEFRATVESYYNDIMSKWTAGTGRDVAVNAFEDFSKSASKYKQILSDVSQSISEAINNYQR
jgi:uncharacterized protein YukE